MNEELGKGQFAVVYKGFNIETGERVAVKYIDKDAVDVTKLPTLRREAELLQKLNHSNIVKIYHFEESKKKLALVLEFMDRGSLQQILKKYGTLPEETVSVLTRESLNGLNYLHQEGIIHRDIKAGNILINEKAQVKLADFGTAKPEDQNKNFTVIGTPYWMAPEVIELTGVGAKSDVWSLGCTVLELLIGHPPYFDLSTMQALFFNRGRRPSSHSTWAKQRIRTFSTSMFYKRSKKKTFSSDSAFSSLDFEKSSYYIYIN
uniref:non-specific serine/threonine protein kinase n=2 Tax=Arcella intermedia TaxID=1963864 RepID=A0A6B2LDL9_9EUKA